MALIRPSLTLVLDVDERLASEETVLELKRCYMHICSPLVRKHAPRSQNEPVSNTARAIVNFGQRSYLRSADEGADELWDDVVEHWIGNILHKTGSNMKAFNRRQRLIGLPEVVFDKFDIELGGGEFTVSLHPDLLGFVPEELNAAVGLARALLNDGTFAGACCVRIPADEAYERQRGAAWETWQAEHPEPEAERPIEQSGEQAPKIDYNDPEWIEHDRKMKSYENTAVPVTDSDDLPPIEREEVVEPPEPFSFEVDYSVWGVQFADGAERLFDSSALAFVE